VQMLIREALATRTPSTAAARLTTFDPVRE
jgi:hypothetical protein